MKNFLNGTLIAGALVIAASPLDFGTIAISRGQTGGLSWPVDKNWFSWTDRPPGHTERSEWSKPARTEKKRETA